MCFSVSETIAPLYAIHGLDGTKISVVGSSHMLVVISLATLLYLMYLNSRWLNSGHGLEGGARVSVNLPVALMYSTSSLRMVSLYSGMLAFSSDPSRSCISRSQRPTCSPRFLVRMLWGISWIGHCNK